MSGKLGKAAIVVLVLAAALAVPTLAEGETPVFGRGLGQVMDLGDDSLTVETRSGQIRTLHVDEATTFEDRSGAPSTFADVEVGDWLAGTYEREAEGTLYARRVVILGPELPRVDVRAAGEITAVNPGSSTFELHTRQGEDLQLVVTEDTRFRSRDGSIQSIGDLRRGMIAAVAAVRGGDGVLEARFAAVGERDDLPVRPNVDVRVAGRITSVEGSSFAVETLAGAEKMFSVDGSTVFRSRDGSVEGIEDLRPGMRAIVAAEDLGNGEWRAVWVGAGRPMPGPGGPTE